MVWKLKWFKNLIYPNIYEFTAKIWKLKQFENLIDPNICDFTGMIWILKWLKIKVIWNFNWFNRRCYFLPFHFFLFFSKNRRVEGNSNFEITISFHFYINFRNCYLLPFWLLFPSTLQNCNFLPVWTKSCRLYECTYRLYMQSIQ